MRTGGLSRSVRRSANSSRTSTPIATRLGCTAELRGALEIMDRGSSYLRQREVVDAGGSLHDVVDSLIAELHADAPAERPAVFQTVGKSTVAAAD